ncbi:MAG: energy transducer TonB [Cytophagia bacterium]|nr:MAG: energy transducer TonB [Runella sp.]TAG17614.1 MAG: energy transducer TonB [Cytophagales bacterium]TAG36594.1 MAG: energy transducer TonB [Cytophagia bacterium]TAG52025.1 MAG: energy transducer TonB [Runella slithyformis]TAG78176.1 MAG: energy transducer TonB [Cytophagales bacterium]
MAEIKPSDMTLDDIIFANRNQAYGAYELRKVYPKMLTRALIIGGSVFLLAMAAPTLISLIPSSEQEVSMTEVDLMKLPPPPIDPNEPLPPPPPPVELPKVNTVQFLPPEVKKDEEVPEEAPPPTVEELKEAVAAEKTQEGDPNAEEVIVAPEETGPVKEEAKAVEVVAEETIFQVVEQQPEFPGGTSAMMSYLGKNIKYPAAASRANVSGKVYLTFVVNTDGSIQDVQTLKGLGFGCDEEAQRVIRSMPKWKPGKQSGRSVRVKFNLPVSFVLE